MLLVSPSGSTYCISPFPSHPFSIKEIIFPKWFRLAPPPQQSFRLHLTRVRIRSPIPIDSSPKLENTPNTREASNLFPTDLTVKNSTTRLRSPVLFNSKNATFCGYRRDSLESRISEHRCKKKNQLNLRPELNRIGRSARRSHLGNTM